jgi:hypothetical protein
MPQGRGIFTARGSRGELNTKYHPSISLRMSCQKTMWEERISPLRGSWTWGPEALGIGSADHRITE